ncbi:MAG: ribulose-phosphate 3-epimerase [Planctomycetota bacterium]
MASTRDILRGPARVQSGSALVGASILGADFARLADDTASAVDAGCELLHVDVMDGHFVPNLSMGPAVCAAARRAFPDVSIDVHLMVTDPADYVAPFRDAGADHVTFHAEVGDVDGAVKLGEAIRAAGMTSGLSVKPGTDLEPWLGVFGAFDMALVMSVEPGFAGQSFIDGAVDRIAAIAATAHRPRWISVDGGVGQTNSGACRAAGCNYLVAASSIYREPPYQRGSAVRALAGG